MKTDAVKYFPVLLLIKEKTVDDKGIKNVVSSLFFIYFFYLKAVGKCHNYKLK